MAIVLGQKSNSANMALAQNLRKQKPGGVSGSGSSVSYVSGISVEYADDITAGQLIAILDGKAYHPSVVFANNKAAVGVALITGDAGTIGAYDDNVKITTATSATQGVLYLSSTAPYYNDTPLYSDGACWQIVGRQTGSNVAVIACESPVEVDYEPEE